MLSAAEKTVFQAFVNFCPDFAGVRVKCEEGPDPPDYICTDETGKRIGVELGEWLNEQQMKRSKERERLEDSYCAVLRSEVEDPPPNIEWVWLYEKSGTRLAAPDAELFKTEAYRCVRLTQVGRPILIEMTPKGTPSAILRSTRCWGSIWRGSTSGLGDV